MSPRPSIPRREFCAALCALAAASAGCRGARPPVTGQAVVGAVYDTALEQELRSGKAIPLVQEAWGRYVDTLSEPVAITNWRDGVSTWDVYFATNRGRMTSPEGTRALFGNVVLDQPQYGLASVTLPKRRRGVDPVQAGSKKSVVPAAFRRDQNTEDQVVKFEAVEMLADESFLEGVADQVNRSRQKDLLVFVHGFNVDFDSAILRTAQVALDMPFNGAIVAYAWPSQGGITSYSGDEPINSASVEPFAQFLATLVHKLPEETRISIVVHSMGNRIVMQALNRAPLEGRLENVVLCAPDVGLADFRAWAPGVVKSAKRVTLYASENDAALIASKGLHADQRAGDADPAVVVEGVETIDCSTVDYTSFLGHSYYGANVDVLGDLFMVLKENRGAAERPHLGRESNPAGGYWVFEGRGPNNLWTWHFDEEAKPTLVERLQRTREFASK
jgi:esterase/lipase superfamily enzyme